MASILKTKMFAPTGRTIASILRKGKQLDFVFSDGVHMLSGLGMSGGWRVSLTSVNEKHTHIQFTCENSNGRVYFAYVDPRRFGNCHLVDAPTAAKMLGRLGTDISSKETKRGIDENLLEQLRDIDSQFEQRN